MKNERTGKGNGMIQTKTDNAKLSPVFGCHSPESVLNPTASLPRLQECKAWKERDDVWTTAATGANATNQTQRHKFIQAEHQRLLTKVTVDSYRDIEGR